jgi:plastocyanin
MKHSNLIWIIVLVSLLLAVSGCGGKEDGASKPVVQQPVAEEAEEPELPTEGVQDVESDVGEEPVEPEAEAPSEEEQELPDAAPTDVPEVAAPEEVAEPSNGTGAQTAENYRVVSLKDLKAYPEEMKVKVGTTVEWRNVNDKLQHIIGWNGQKQMGVKPEPILAGESWSFTFNAPGTIKWFSTARPTIQGIIYVEE